MNWPELLRIPDAGVDAWFGAVAAQLLNGAELRVAGQSLRPADVELYLHSAGHADPFAHRNPLQLRCGYWYFHRTHGGLRGGTYKGMDLTYGNGTACGGVLIRSLVRPDGTVIDGPSLCVDHLLALTGHRTVAELDRAVAGRLAWDTDNPLSLIRVDNHEPHDILRTPRVGLTLLRAKQLGAMPRYLMRPYRFVGEPRKVAKGKPHMVLALYARRRRGDDPARHGLPAPRHSPLRRGVRGRATQGGFRPAPRHRRGAAGVVSAVRGMVARVQRLSGRKSALGAAPFSA